jgi:hypothetical protein
MKKRCRGRKERGERKGRGELWARREEEGEVRWESTRDSFYIPLPQRQHRRTRKQSVSRLSWQKGRLQRVTVSAGPRRLSATTDPQIRHPNGLLQHPPTPPGPISSASAGCAPRSPQALAFLGMQSDQRMRGHHPNLQCRRINGLLSKA